MLPRARTVVAEASSTAMAAASRCCLPSSVIGHGNARRIVLVEAEPELAAGPAKEAHDLVADPLRWGDAARP